MAKAGRFAEAAQYFKTSIEEDEIICYAKEHWPEAEAEWIEKNKDELKELVEQEHICGKCMCLKRCRTNGYRRVGSIDKYTGFLILKMEVCSMKRMEKMQAYRINGLLIKVERCAADMYIVRNIPGVLIIRLLLARSSIKS